MRKSKLFFAALLCAFFASVTTYANTPDTDPTEMRQEIMKLVKQIDVSDIDSKYERTYIKFMVNSENEIVVVNVSSSELDSRIKAKLNYKKLTTLDVTHNEIYTIPVVFKMQ
jgi:spermidine/putrescine-binding protein